MEDLTAVATITGTLKAAADTLKIIVGLGRGAEFRAKTDELRSQINAAMSDALTAYEAQSTQLQRIRQLEKEAGEVETWRLEKSRYELNALQVGVFAYMLKPAERGAEPPHWICTNCYEQGHKALVHQVPTSPMRTGWECQFCKTKIYPPTNAVEWID